MSTSYREMAYKFFKSKGLSDEAIAGILGNMMVESSFNPSAYNAGENAIGFGQWEGGRRTALQQFAAHHGGSETDPQIQLEFMWHELNTGYSGVLSQLRNVKTAADAAAIFDGQYEISSGSTRQDRINYATQFYSGKGPNPSYAADSAGATQLTGGGSSGGAQPMTKADFQNVDNLGHLLDSVPELSKLVDQAVANNWSTDKFQNAVEDSSWYKQHSTSARAAIIQQANDPASWKQSFDNEANSVRSLARQLGMALSPDVVNAIANHALLTGNDSNQQWLTAQISRHEDYSHLSNLGSLQGGMAATSQQLQALAENYGMNWTPAQIAQRAQDIIDGHTTIDTYQQNLISWAKSAFPALADQIDAGQTVKALADPYIQSMSNLLEVDPGTLNLFTPAIRRALQGATDPKTKTRASIPLWQFEDQVRADPRWQYTQNARDTMATSLLKIGADFGFGPTSSG